MNDSILTAKQAFMLTEKRDKTILLLSEAIAKAAIDGKYYIHMYPEPKDQSTVDLERLYWENENYFSSYLRALGYSVKWLYMQYIEISWGQKEEVL